MSRIVRGQWLVALVGAVVLGVGAGPALAQSDELVSTGSPPSPFAQNKQNEPALAVDPTNPNVLVSGSNDEVDLQACASASDPRTCPFTRLLLL
jgi:hypothetical protein